MRRFVAHRANIKTTAIRQTQGNLNQVKQESSPAGRPARPQPSPRIRGPSYW